MPKFKAKDIKKFSENENLQKIVQDCLTMNFNGRSARMAEWAKLDRVLKGVKDREKGNGGRLDETVEGQDYLDDVNVPIMYMIYDTLCSQLFKIFFSKENTFQYNGMTANDVDGATKMGAVTLAAEKKFRNRKELRDCIKSGVKYGVSMVGLSWKTCYERKAKAYQGGRVFKDEKVLSGAKLTNVNMYRSIMDPHVPPDKIEQMRFIGQWNPVSYYDLMRIAEVKEEELSDFSWIFSKSVYESQLPALFNLQATDNKMGVRVDLYVDIIPAEVFPNEVRYKKRTDPEVFHIQAIGPSMILDAKPAKIPEGKYPYFTLALDGDGYDLEPPSRLDLGKDIQSVYNWLFNSHIFAIRQDIDGTHIWDPLLINGEDVEAAKNDPRPSRWIRLNQNAWGMLGATEKGIHKIPTQNNTNQYLAESEQLVTLMKIISGATDPLIGAAENPSSRRTAEEIAQVRQAAGERMTSLAGVIHDTFLFPLGMAIAKYTQAMLDHDVVVRLTSDDQYAENVSWLEILVDFDLTVGTGHLSFDESGLINSWQTFINTIFQNPQLMQAFNLVEILKEWAKKMGIKNVDSYVSQPGVMQLKADAVQQLAASGQPA